MTKNRNDFEEALERVESPRQKLADAQTANATAYKEAGNVNGAELWSLKQIVSMKRMDEDKRNLRLRSLLRYATWMGWLGQRDMFDDELEEHIDAAEDGEGDEEFDDQGEHRHQPEGDGAPAELNLEEREPGAEPEEGAEEPTTEWQAGQDGGGDTAALDQGGTAYNDGQAAAEAGKTREDNPHDTKTTAGKLWARGFAKAKKAGAAQRREAAADENARRDLHANGDIAAAVH